MEGPKEAEAPGVHSTGVVKGDSTLPPTPQEASLPHPQHLLKTES